MSELKFRKSRSDKTELPGADFDVVLVQQPHHARLAVVGRDDADPQIELLVADGDLDPPVGGASLLADVDLGQNLDPGDDGRKHPPGGCFSLDTNAVNSMNGFELGPSKGST